MKREILYKKINDIDHKFCKFCNLYHELTEKFWYKSSGKLAKCRKRCDLYSSQESVRSKRWAKNISPEEKLKKKQNNKKYRALVSKEKIMAYNKKYLSKPNVKEKRRNYAKKDSYKKIKLEWIKNKLKTDPVFRAKTNIRRRINSVIKSICNGKNYLNNIRSTELLGCSLEEFKTHLENRFAENMSWNNYGEWQVDHIIPFSNFDPLILEDMKKCNHYSNLQPLWQKDNASKGNRLDWVKI